MASAALLVLLALAAPRAALGQLSCPPAAAAAAARLPAAFIGLGRSKSGLYTTELPAIVAVQGNQMVETLMFPTQGGGSCAPTAAYGYIISTCIASVSSVAAVGGTNPTPARAVAVSGIPGLIGACHFFVNGPAGSGTVFLNYSKPSASTCPYNASTSRFTGPFEHTLTNWNTSAAAAIPFLKCPAVSNVIPSVLFGNGSYLGTATNPTPAGVAVYSLTLGGRSMLLYRIYQITLCAMSATFLSASGTSVYELRFGNIVPAGAIAPGEPPFPVTDLMHCEWVVASETTLQIYSLSADITIPSGACPTSFTGPGVTLFSIASYFGSAPAILPSVSPTPSPSAMAPSASPSAQPQGAWTCPPGAGAAVPPQLQGSARIPASAITISINNRTMIVANDASGDALTYCIDGAVPYNRTLGSETFILQVRQPAGTRYSDNSTGTPSLRTTMADSFVCVLVRVAQAQASGSLGPPPPRTLSFDRVPAFQSRFDAELLIFNEQRCVNPPPPGVSGAQATSSVFCDVKAMPSQVVLPNYGAAGPLSGERWTTSCPFSTVPPELFGRGGFPASVTGFVDETIYITAGSIAASVNGVIMHDHCVQSARRLDPVVSGVAYAWEVVTNGTSQDFAKCLWLSRNPATNTLGVAINAGDSSLCPTSFANMIVAEAGFFSASLPLPSASASPGGGASASPSATLGGGASVSPAAGASASPTVSGSASASASALAPGASPSASSTLTPPASTAGASASATDSAAAASPTSSPSVSGSVGASGTPTSSLSLSGTLSPTISVSTSLTPTPTISLSPTASATPSFSSSPTLSTSSTATPSITPSHSSSPFISISSTATPSVSASPSPTVTQTGTSSPSPSVTPSTSPSATSGSIAVGLSFTLAGLQPPTAIANASVRAAVASAVAGALAACDGSPGGLVRAGLVSVSLTLAADTGSGAVLFSALGGGGGGGGGRRLAGGGASGVLAINATALFSSAASASAAMAAASNGSYAARVAQLAQRPTGGAAAPAALLGGTLAVAGVAASSSSSALAAGGAAASAAAPAAAASGSVGAAAGGAAAAVLLVVGALALRRRSIAVSRKKSRLTKAMSWHAARKSDPSLPSVVSSANAYRNLVAGGGGGGGGGGAAAGGAPRVLVASPLAAAAPRRATFDPQQQRSSV